MRILIDDIDAQRDTFLRIHSGPYVGSSEIGAVVGLNPFITPLQLYAQKMGLSPMTEENQAMRLGRKLEPVVASLFAEDRAADICRVNQVWQHETDDWAVASPDYLYATERGVERNKILECKTTSWFGKAAWEDGSAPDYALAQIQWQLGISGLECGSLACLVAGRDLIVKDVHFDAEAFKLLHEAATRFMERIYKASPPEPTASDSKVVNLLARPEKGIEVERPDLLLSVEQYNEMKAKFDKRSGELEVLKAQLDAVKNKLRLELRDAARARVGRFQLSVSIAQYKERVQPAYEVTRFSVKEIK